MDEFAENVKPVSLEDELSELIAKKMAENKLLKKLRESLVANDGPLTLPEDDEEITTSELTNQ